MFFGAVIMMSELTTGDALRTRLPPEVLLHQRDMYNVPVVSRTYRLDKHSKPSFAAELEGVRFSCSHLVAIAKRNIRGQLIANTAACTRLLETEEESDTLMCSH